MGGFENRGAELGGGLAVTGNYPGQGAHAGRTARDLEQALALIPGRHRLNLHACYAETGGASVERNEIGPEHFQTGSTGPKRRASASISIRRTSRIRRPRTASRSRIATPAIRRFWIEHGIACRRIGAALGKALGTPCVTNVWIPDGYKDTPADRSRPARATRRFARRDLRRSRSTRRHQLDAVEAKLFGIGSESYVVGSHEFYLGYAITRKKLLCLDAGHFHPTESIADKISSVLL